MSTTRKSKTTKPTKKEVVDDTPADVEESNSNTFLTQLRAQTQSARDDYHRDKQEKEEAQRKLLDETFAELADQFEATFLENCSDSDAVRRGFVDVLTWNNGEKYNDFPYNYLLRGTRDEKLGHFTTRGITPVQERLVKREKLSGLSINVRWNPREERNCLRLSWA